MNATETIQGTDLEILELLDFEESDACEMTRFGQPCGDHATTLIVHTCCGRSRLSCGWHVRATVDYLAAVMGPVICRLCTAEPAPYPAFLPLGGPS